MYKIISRKQVAPKTKLFEVYAPEIAKKAKPGQFIILMICEKGERIPLNIAGYNVKKGTITFAFSERGKTTRQLGLLNKGDYIENITGPLGNPSKIRNFGRVLCVAGGVMIAPMIMQVRALQEAGNNITSIIGARVKEQLFFEKEMKSLSNNLFLTTDDGSVGYKGLDFLTELLRTEKFDHCIVMGPVSMMKSVCEITKPHGIPTIVTLTPIMIDGIGMCGVCRVTVGDKTKFACVDGPEFEGHSVNFDELIQRQRMLLPEERVSSLIWEKIGGK